MLKKKSKFAEVYSNYYSLVYSAVYTKISDADDAEDICQDVFYKYYEKLETVENPRKWLYGALRLEVFNYYRKNNNSHVSIDDVFNDIGLTFVNAMRDVRILISEAIESDENFENETERVLFELIAVHNFTYEKTGEQLGLNKRQVRYRYGLIVEKVMKFLSKKGINSFEELL